MKYFITRPLALIILLCCIAETVKSEDIYHVVVAQDGSGDYKTIQEAVNSIRDFGFQRAFIHIKKGIYKEKLVIPSWKTRISLIGEDVEKTIITWDDYNKKGNTNTFTSYTVQVCGKGFYAENITFENSSGNVGQAVAIHVEGDKCVFRNCRFIGNQDTLYAAGEGSQQYYADCYIEGTTDFIFGAATAVFDNCTIHSKKSSYITAASTPGDVEFGYVFIDCDLTSDFPENTIYLGRPWRPYARTVFIRCNLSKHIRKEGWHNWSHPERETTVFYGEYGNYGPGSDTTQRVSWSRQLNEEEASGYTPGKIFTGSTADKYETEPWYLFREQ